MAPGILGMEPAAVNAVAVPGTSPAAAVLAFLSVLDTCLGPNREAPLDDQDAPPDAAEAAVTLAFNFVSFSPVPVCVQAPCPAANGVRDEKSGAPASAVSAPVDPPAEVQTATEPSLLPLDGVGNVPQTAVPPPAEPPAEVRTAPEIALPTMAEEPPEAAPDRTPTAGKNPVPLGRGSVTASLHSAKTEPRPQGAVPARRPEKQNSEPEREEHPQERPADPPARGTAPPEGVVIIPVAQPETTHPAPRHEAAPAAISTAPATPGAVKDPVLDQTFRRPAATTAAPAGPVAFELRLAPIPPAPGQAPAPISGIPATPIRPNIERPAGKPAPADAPAVTTRQKAPDNRPEASPAPPQRENNETTTVRAVAASRWTGPDTEKQPHSDAIPRTAVPAPAPDAPTDDAAPPIDAPPAPLAAEPSEPRHPAAPVRALTLTVEGQQEKVDIRMAERAGGIHVSVHAPESNLRRELQDQLPELIRGLERQGFAAESWHPASARSDARESGAQDAPHGGQAGGQGGAAQDGRGRRKPPPPAWLEEIRKSAQGEPQPERSASLWQ